MDKVVIDLSELHLELIRNEQLEFLLGLEQLVLPVGDVSDLFLLSQVCAFKVSDCPIDLDAHIVIKLFNLVGKGREFAVLSLHLVRDICLEL